MPYDAAATSTKRPEPPAARARCQCLTDELPKSGLPLEVLESASRATGKETNLMSHANHLDLVHPAVTGETEAQIGVRDGKARVERDRPPQVVDRRTPLTREIEGIERLREMHFGKVRAERHGARNRSGRYSMAHTQCQQRSGRAGNAGTGRSPTL